MKPAPTLPPSLPCISVVFPSLCHISCLSLGLHLVPFSSAPRVTHSLALTRTASRLVMVILSIWLDLSSLYRVPAVF